MSSAEAIRLRPAGGRSARRSPASAGERPALIGVAIIGILLSLLAGNSSLIARGVIGALGLVVLAVVALSSTEVALVTLVGWLAVLGFVRRLLIPFAGWSTYDPLLLISPIAAVLLILGLRARADIAPRRRTLLSSLAIFLLLWTVAEVVNPQQTSLVVAAQGAMFVVTPLLWFFVGRRLSSRQHDLVLTTIVVMDIPIVLEGLYHTFVGFLPFELHWIGVSGQSAAIFLPGMRIRPFSVLTSPQEYGIALSIAAMVIAARLMTSSVRRRPLLVLYLVTVMALFLQGSRSIFLAYLGASAVQFLARYRSVAAGLVVAAVAAAGAYLLLGAAHPATFGTTSDTTSVSAGKPSSASSLIDRQLSGLQHPEQSTAPAHLALIQQSFRTAYDHPLGLGSAAGTIAATKATGRNQGANGADVGDVANAAQSMGIIGGVAMVAFILLGFGGAFRLQRQAPSMRNLAWLGILTASANQWFNGGLYYTSTIDLLVLGGIASAVSAQVAARMEGR